MSARPPVPASAKLPASCSRLQSLRRIKPIVSPRKANAAQGKIGNSHGWGWPRLGTPNDGECDLVRSQSLLPQFVNHQGEGNSCEEEKQRSRQGAAELRPHEKLGLARVATQPRVVAVGLKHQYAGQAAHPVDINEPRGLGNSHVVVLRDAGKMRLRVSCIAAV